MRKGHCLIVSVLVLGPASLLAAGCIDLYEKYYAPLTDPRLAVYADAGDSGSDGSGTGGAGGGDGGNQPDCSGDPTQDPTLVRDECGVFVSATAAPGGDGTKATPFSSFADAASTGARRVFACAGAYTETAKVSFGGGVEVYGGFTDCTSAWTWSASSNAQVTAAPDVPGVLFDGGANHVENLSVTATGATAAGGSSIAMVVNGGSLEMINGALAAGDAKDGDAGKHLNVDATLDGELGDPGANACSAGTHAGPMGKTKDCATGGSSTAGSGGDGGDFTSGVPNPAGGGTDGSPADPAQPTKGKGGIGEGEGSPAATSCDSGADGANGNVGESGDGATGIGTISKEGYAGAPGNDGMNGKPGQGGGGGGGAKGAKAVDCGSGNVDVLGASGGAGGTGGCGGALGGGGKPGGSSIALLVLDANVTLANVTLSAGQGGNGGKGGDGQSGGKKGKPGDPGAGGSAHDACAGGWGGQGGSGGPGGGGQGGHSLGIAFQGTTTPTGGTFQIDTTKNGKGGPGGNNSTAADAGHGAGGLAASCWDFGTNQACGK